MNLKRIWTRQKMNLKDGKSQGLLGCYLLNQESYSDQLYQQYASFIITAGGTAPEYRYERDRKLHVTGLMMAFDLMECFTGIKPEKIMKSNLGKPYFPAIKQQFTISHAGDLVVCYVGEQNCGIDVELVKPLTDMEYRVAHRIFTDTEYQYFQQFEKEAADFTFFDLWTAKESYLKATGEGITVPMKQIEVISDNARWKDNVHQYNQIPQLRAGLNDYLQKKNLDEKTYSIHGWELQLKGE